MNKDLLYWIPAGQYGKEGVLSLLAQHPEIRFVSLIGIDLAGNDTDEKIPIEIFMKDYDDFFAGKAVQTDGSSVVFMNIATLNDARVDFVADSTVNWYVIIMTKMWTMRRDCRWERCVFPVFLYTMTNLLIPVLF